MSEFTGKTLEEISALVDNTIAMSQLTIIDDLTYASYKAQREQFPATSPERWAALFPHAAEMEKIYQHQRKLVEFEGYFRSEEFVANALGLRKELQDLQPKHCEAPLRTNGDGTEAVECGKKTVNGSRLCAEHYDEELI